MWHCSSSHCYRGPDIFMLTFHSVFRCIQACMRHTWPAGRCPGNRCQKTWEVRQKGGILSNRMRIYVVGKWIMCRMHKRPGFLSVFSYIFVHVVVNSLTDVRSPGTDRDMACSHQGDPDLGHQSSRGDTSHTEGLLCCAGSSVWARAHSSFCYNEVQNIWKWRRWDFWDYSLFFSHFFHHKVSHVLATIFFTSLFATINKIVQTGRLFFPLKKLTLAQTC